MNQNEQQNGGGQEIDPRFDAAHYGHDLYVGDRPGDGMVSAALSSSASDPVGEPVAWAVFAPNGNIRVWSTDPNLGWAKDMGLTVTPLYASPLPQEPREAELTDERIRELARQYTCVNGSHVWVNETLFARAIERELRGAQEVTDQRERDFETGWRTAANWMQRDDLLADVGSPAYLADRAAALGGAAQEGKAGEWLPMNTAPLDGEFLAAIQVRHGAGDGPTLWHMHVLALDDEDGGIHADYDQGWELGDYEGWQPLPAPPSTTESADSRGEKG